MKKIFLTIALFLGTLVPSFAFAATFSVNPTSSVGSDDWNTAVVTCSDFGWGVVVYDVIGQVYGSALCSELASADNLISSVGNPYESTPNGGAGMYHIVQCDEFEFYFCANAPYASLGGSPSGDIVFTFTDPASSGFTPVVSAGVIVGGVGTFAGKALIVLGSLLGLLLAFLVFRWGYKTLMSRRRAEALEYLSIRNKKF